MEARVHISHPDVNYLRGNVDCFIMCPHFTSRCKLFSRKCWLFYNVNTYFAFLYYWVRSVCNINEWRGIMTETPLLWWPTQWSICVIRLNNTCGALRHHWSFSDAHTSIRHWIWIFWRLFSYYILIYVKIHWNITFPSLKSLRGFLCILLYIYLSEYSKQP